MEIRPHEGPQEVFLATPADIAIYGGAAGGGKTWALILEPMRHIENPDFGATIFRRTSPQITNQGGLWDESMRLYPFLGAKPLSYKMEWTFPSGARVKFSHLEHESNVLDHQGSQLPFIGFDELPHFCLTPDTDVLTESGWKPLAAVEVGERVASLNPDRTISHREVLDTHTSHFDGELVSLFQRCGVSFRATPNHRVLVDRQDAAKSWGFVTAEHLAKTCQSIPRTGKWQGRERRWVKIPRVSGRGIGRNSEQVDRIAADDYLELLGWYLAEGSAFLRCKRRSTPCVSVRQTSRVASLDSLMARIPWRPRPDESCGYRIHSRQLFNHLKPLGNRHEKRVPRWVMSLSPRQQRIFLDAFLKGDGHLQSTGAWAVGLCNSGLVDDLQEIAVYCGLVATRSSYETKTGFTVHTINISRGHRNATQVKAGLAKREAYSGPVHCLTVEGNGNFFIRHRGRCCWTGNSEHQFWYMMSRNRSTCGVRPYVRATCNPDADSWVANLIAWWIDQDTGVAIPERSGVLRWFYRVHDRLEWYDSEAEAREAHPDLSAITAPKSLTFIAARLQDNPTLMKADPGYLANLMGMPLVDRERLLGGNWKIRPTSGNFFRLEWLSKFVDQAPRKGRRIRYWDKAGGESLKSDRSAGVLMCESDGLFYIEHVECGRWSPMARNQVMLATAEQDAAKYGQGQVDLWIEREPGHNSKEVMAIHARDFARFAPRFDAVNTAKEVRARPLSAQCEAGNVRLVRGPWVKDLLDELTNFPPPKDSNGHDDLVDACSGAFNKLTLAPTGGMSIPRGFKATGR